MKTTLLAIFMLFAVPALAGPWISLEPVTLSASSTSVTIPVGEKLGKIDKIRFQISGATVQLDSLVLVPVQGEPAALRIPVQLKSGESSGLISVPGMAVITESLKLTYKISSGGAAQLTMRLKKD